jgi:electron transport complex protein RnfE
MSAKRRARREVPKMNNDSRSIFRYGVITRNPLLFQIVGVCPVVAIAVSFQSAMAIAVITALELIVTEALASLVFKKMKRYIRILLYAIIGFAVNFPMYYLISIVQPELSESIGIFLPLLAVSSVIAVRCETFAVKNPVKATLLDAIANALGYGFVVLVIGSVREVLGSGTFMGKEIGLPYTAEAFLMPFGGFLVLGFVAAAIKGLFSKKYAQEIDASSLDTSQIRMLHIKHLKELIDNSEEETDDVFISVSDLPPEKGSGLFRRKKAPVVSVPQETIRVPEIQDETEETKQTANDRPATVGYQPFADLLATLDSEETEVEEIVVEEPEPDPLQLKEEWDVTSGDEDGSADTEGADNNGQGGDGQ